MTKIVFDYVAPWADVINVVCPDINAEAEKLADLLDSKDIPFEYCVADIKNGYDGKVGLALCGIGSVEEILEGGAVDGYFFDVDAAAALIESQEYGKLVFNNVDYVTVSDYFQKMALMFDFDAFCRSEYESESSNVDSSFPTDEFNETECVSDNELNPKDKIVSNHPFANKTQLMDAAQQSVYKVYKMYAQAIALLFEKDENYEK